MFRPFALISPKYFYIILAFLILTICSGNLLFLKYSKDS
jgi:hypothetical protein